jgi:transposase
VTICRRIIGNYFSVYEAGFSGYWINRVLKEEGTNKIIINSADIPTKDKEPLRKTDKIDARKLVRELSNQ